MSAKTTQHVRHAGNGCRWTLKFPTYPRIEPWTKNKKRFLVLVCTSKTKEETEYFVEDAPSTTAKFALPPGGSQAVLKFKVTGLKGPVVVRHDQFQVPTQALLPNDLKVPKALKTVKQMAGASV
jgi:hypothetical protein